MPTQPRALVVFATIAVAAAIAAVWLAPAALVDARLAGLTAGILRLTNADGTLWRGRGDVVAGAARLPIAWRVEPWPLLRGELRVHVEPVSTGSDRTPRADIAVADGHVVLRDVDVTIPAPALAGAAGSPIARMLTGDVNLATDRLDWAPPSNRGSARLQWRTARLVLTDGGRPLEFGDVAAEIHAEGDRLSGPIANTGGDLTVSGTIELRSNDAARLSLVLAPRGPVDAAMAQALSALGAADNGRWRVEWRLPLR
jgi:general secretion pathway protein N